MAQHRRVLRPSVVGHGRHPAYRMDAGIGLGVTVETVGRAVEIVADDQRNHPVVEWLDRLTWIASRRSTLGSSTSAASKTSIRPCCRSEMDDRRYCRVFQPGAKVDTMLILEGAQGLRKSTALKTRPATRDFLDSLPDLSSKDATYKTSGNGLSRLPSSTR